MLKSVTIVVFVLHICLDYRCVDVRFVFFFVLLLFFVANSLLFHF